MRSLGGNWLTGTLVHDGIGYTFTALAFSEGSIYGIDSGRVSKLAIIRTGGSWSQAVYNYDRGEDVDEAPAGLLTAVLAEIGH